MKNFINFLPPWVETNIQPAFYDKQSGTCIQQTARMYAKVNQLVRIANEQYAKIEEYIDKFVELKDYVEDYFDNLDVQTEIDNKIDSMVADGTFSNIVDNLLASFKEGIDSELQVLAREIDSAVAGTPTPVTSTDDMVDHDKTYLLTTDGYWYYWNGSAWTRGGVYQATDISDFSVSPDKTTFSKRSSNLIDIADAPTISGYASGGAIVSDAGTLTTYVAVEPNTMYSVTRSVNTGRFSIFTTATTPDVGTSVMQKQDGNTSKKLTITTNATAEYLCIYYWNTNHSTNTATQALADLCVVEGNNDSVIPSYIVEVKNDNLDSECVTPDKTTFSKQSSNLFNPKGDGVIGAYPDSGYIVSSGVAKCCYIPVTPNTHYVVHKTQSSRFSVMFTSSIPDNGVGYTSRKDDNNGTQIKVKSGANDHYLVVYYYRQASDGDTEATIRNSIVIVEGTDDITSFIPYGKIVEIGTDNLNDKCVTANKLADGIKDSMLQLGTFSSRNGIFGVEFDLSSNSTKGKRIANAEDLSNDYIVGDDYALNQGHNDFDSIYPWCEMRRCNLKIENGVRVVTYDTEDDFALDGTNGDVMVEIPKFYSYRKRIGNKEVWAISGEPKAEFEVEPAFVVDGKELDYVYVSCYEASTANNGAYSSTGTTPLTRTQKTTFIDNFANNSLQAYDVTIFHMLQKLVTIEFADRDIQSYLGGVTYLPYFYTGDTYDTITAIDTNKVTVPYDSRKGALWVGERIKLLNSTTGESGENYARFITDIEIDGSDVTITYSGSDLSGTINIGDGFGGCPQINGLTDDLAYHTGRTTYASGNEYESFVNPMRYRYIENLFGNMWEQICGLRVKNLKYYYSNIPNYNQDTSADGWYKMNYDAPLQDQLGEGGAGYIVAEGYDTMNRGVAFPTVVGSSNGGGADKYFADAFYSRNASNTEYESTVGGGWDHYMMSGIFCLRSWNALNSASGLEGNRAIYRG